jgi:Na+/H+ antiporter NhaD/arsenite permease-like protein
MACGSLDELLLRIPVDEVAAYWLTLIVFALTYLGLAWGTIPGLRTDRSGIAWAGAALVLATTLLTFRQAIAAVDFATLALLLGMMVLVAMLRLSAVFDRAAEAVLARVRGPFGLLAATMALTGVLSAVLVNDVVCLALTPLVLRLARSLKLEPKPHLIGVALASNIGSTATLTGNPQNMIIGSLSQISYLRFAAKLAPIAVVSLVVSYLITAFVFRASLTAKAAESTGDAPTEDPDANKNETSPWLSIKSVVVTFAAVALFFAGVPMEIVALAAAAILLLGRTEPDRIYREIDWPLLVMFAGLFVVVRAFELHVVKTWGVEDWAWLKTDPVVPLSIASAVLSNLVSNVPAVLLFKPVIAALSTEHQETAWLALSMSSTLAGNFTTLGSVANLIVIECARRRGVTITFLDYIRAGIPVTIVSLAIGMLWLWAVRY